MPILPLPQFEEDLKAYQDDLKVYERLKAPTSIVVRFGRLRMVGEYPYSGDAKPGCGSKLVVRTHRGVELAEMLTSTCPNAGCSKSVSRKEMLEYIQNSGGKDYPFFNQGKVLRVATAEDMAEQARLDEVAPRMLLTARETAARLMLPMKVVDAEPILGGDRLTFHFTSEERIDFREFVNELAREFRTRIEVRQVGARDEARITADYERCGQHCCCKQFLKVLKPVSMKSAKVQKATLDPLKISGRCGRLMCCLRYEDQTYDELRARLPRKKSRVWTDEGWGIVMDGQILTQLVLVRLEAPDGLPGEKEIAVAVEDLKFGAEAEAAAAEVGAAKAAADAERRAALAAQAAAQAARQSAPQQPRQRPAGGPVGGGGGGGGGESRGGQTRPDRAGRPGRSQQPDRSRPAPPIEPRADRTPGSMPKPRDLGARPPRPPAPPAPPANPAVPSAELDEPGVPEGGPGEAGQGSSGASPEQQGERRRRRRRRRRGGGGGGGSEGPPPGGGGGAP